MIKKTLLSFIVVLGATLQGCATLSKSECKEADWHLIGLEDGAAGRPVSYVSRHRKACAEYGVKPKMAKYQSGHREGVISFCTPRKAFQLGSSGRGHQDVCPSELRGPFLAAFDDGRELYSARRALEDANNLLHKTEKDLDGVIKNIADLEAQLVSGGGSTEQRQAWLNEIKRLQAEQKDIRASLHDLEHEASERQSEFNYLSAQFQY